MARTKKVSGRGHRWPLKMVSYMAQPRAQGVIGRILQAHLRAAPNPIHGTLRTPPRRITLRSAAIPNRAAGDGFGHFLLVHVDLDVLSSISSA